MNPTYKDITGMKFNRLTVIERAGSDKQNRAKWLCQCDCGRKTVVNTSSLRNGHTKSCGCLFIEQSKANLPKDVSNEKNPNYRHGGSKQRLYHIWVDIKRRCYDKNCDHYYTYGARGIKICKEWKNSYPAFREWAEANGFRHDSTGREQSIDRIDVNKDYSPDNCRFITYSENTRLRNIDYWGKRKLIRGEGSQE